jgi:hypothetical protein
MNDLSLNITTSINHLLGLNPLGRRKEVLDYERKSPTDRKVKSYTIDYRKDCARREKLAKKIQVAVSKSFFANSISYRVIGTALNETFGYMVYPKVSILPGKRAIESGGTRSGYSKQ